MAIRWDKTFALSTSINWKSGTLDTLDPLNILDVLDTLDSVYTGIIITKQNIR